MYNTLLSPAGFRKGMDLYFQRHDGSAVTCDDFRAAMADANKVDLDQFALWYSTPGTPVVTYSYSYDEDSGRFILTLSQKSKSSKPLHIPVAIGLIDKATGKEVAPTTVLNLKHETQAFVFDGLNGDVVPSILRDFSAPVKLAPAFGPEDETLFAFLAAHDTDGFSKWESGQKLFTSFIFQTMRGEDEHISQTEAFVYEAFGRTLADLTITDYSIKAYSLTLPSESGLFEELEVVDPTAVRNARKEVKKRIARKFQEEIRMMYDKLTTAMEADAGEFKVDAESRGRRALRNVLLDYLCSISETAEEQNAAASLALNHYNLASGLTDKMAAFQCLVSMSGAAAKTRDEVIDNFYQFAKGNPLALDKWFQTQAMADLPDVLDRVKSLANHPDFTQKNPNRFRSLISVFTMNAAPFHQENGEGYKFIGQKIAEIDKLNPQVSSRLCASSLIQWRRYGSDRAALMKAELSKLADMKPISDDLFEIVQKGLKS
jgi:aminopeptidase N